MTWVKICGITNLEDANVAVKAGADALGFVFYEKSPRNVQPELAREIVAKLPDRIEKVGVFVDASAQGVADVADKVGLTAVQLYVNEGRRLAKADYEQQGFSFDVRGSREVYAGWQGSRLGIILGATGESRRHLFGFRHFQPAWGNRSAL